MNTYYNILVAVDLAGDDGYLIESALQIASEVSNIRLISVVAPMIYPGDVFAGDLVAQDQQRIERDAEQQLAELAKKYGLSDSGHITATGRAATEIHRAAEENAINLIVVGSHGRHGLQRLLGSTANAVLHGANCDVLAVRVQSN